MSIILLLLYYNGRKAWQTMDNELCGKLNKILPNAIDRWQYLHQKENMANTF